MKRNILLVFALISFSLPIPIFAIGGTCSWHGGVDCSAGADWDGSAICNDGWTDSSEKFYDTKECTQKLHYCTTEEYNQISSKFNLNEQYRVLSELNNKILAINPVSQDTSGQNITSSAVQRNSADIARTNYIEASKIYQQWLPLKAKYDGDFNNAKQECFALGEKAYAISIAEATRQRAELLYGNQSSQTKTCKDGYVLVGNACIDNSLNCMNQYGKSSYYDNGACQCASGYKMDFYKSKCIPLSESSCQLNATLVNGKCSCNAGAISDGHNNCVLLTTYCQIMLKTTASTDGLSCDCPQGQVFNKTTNLCSVNKVKINERTFKEPTIPQNKADQTLPLKVKEEVKKTDISISTTSIPELIRPTASAKQTETFVTPTKQKSFNEKIGTFFKRLWFFN